jgi:hypothetical protein
LNELDQRRLVNETALSDEDFRPDFRRATWAYPAVISRERWSDEQQTGTMLPARWGRLIGAIGNGLGELCQLIHVDAQLVQPLLDRCGSFGVVSR